MASTVVENVVENGHQPASGTPGTPASYTTLTDTPVSEWPCGVLIVQWQHPASRPNLVLIPLDLWTQGWAGVDNSPVMHNTYVRRKFQT